MSYRCGYSSGLDNAPRFFYNAQVKKLLATDHDFKHYVDSLYGVTYRSFLDSVLRADNVVNVVSRWLEAHPGCELKKERIVPISKSGYEKGFYKPVR